jgi:hypothetical protein
VQQAADSFFNTIHYRFINKSIRITWAQILRPSFSANFFLFNPPVGKIIIEKWIWDFQISWVKKSFAAADSWVKFGP